MLVFTMAASLMSAPIFGVASSWRSVETSSHDSIKSQASGIAGSRRLANIRASPVVVECALAVVLLSGARLLLRSLVHVQAVNPGFTAENVMVFRLNPSPSIGAEPSTTKQRFVTQEAVLNERLGRIGGCLAWCPRGSPAN